MRSESAVINPIEELKSWRQDFLTQSLLNFTQQIPIGKSHSVNLSDGKLYLEC